MPLISRSCFPHCPDSFKAKHACSSLRHVQLFAMLWTAALQAPLSMECSRQEYLSRLPFPPAGDFPDPDLKNPCLQHLLHWQVDSLPLSHLGSLFKPNLFLKLSEDPLLALNSLAFSSPSLHFTLSCDDHSFLNSL